ncbi:hypothetical protein NP493_215g07037 [Ridgeia piscesae]|uniref:NADH dehydrogenase [ubiquinone] 1 beta subcomplex subunit 9 n=1 Tax=Ridgeia piscesae TaxID=27915 RepID=A0AAD9UE56_RIDPI|nr:hypothetical protein NP493_215g07037 [Ridgeia piscesae]
MSYLQTNVISHASRVKRLYKEALRQLQSYYVYRHTYRYQAVLMRARFDEHTSEIDMVKAKKLVLDGEKELFLKQHPQRIRFANSVGGVSFGREVLQPDWTLDMWHPLERQQYPEYFARREQRKKEYIKRWEDKYGTDAAEASH